MECDWLVPENLATHSVAIALATVVTFAIYYYIQIKGLPPGPTGLPWLGYWPFFDRQNLHFQLEEMRKKYGNLFSFTASGRFYVNLGTIKHIREAHITKSDCFDSRPLGFNIFNFVFEDSVAFSNGEQWKVLRKFFLQVMRDRGMGALKDSTASGAFYDEINNTIRELQSKKGQPINIMKLFAEKCNKILQVTLFTKDSITSEEIESINDNYEAILERMNMKNMLLNGTIARYFIAPFTADQRDTQKKLDSMRSIINKIIKEHKDTYNGEHPRDLIDDYFQERNSMQSKGDPTAIYLTDFSLMSSLIQFIGESGLSIATFIALFMKTLLERPEEQEKIYKELIEVVGVDRQPTMEDKSKLTYTNAFLQEAQRKTDFLPFFPTLECTKETTVGGYRIPKGAILLLNAYLAQRDPEVYEDPEKFDPTRYIVAEGKRKPEPPILFGAGKRSCIGESFTMMQIFIFVTSLVKNFRLEAAGGEVGNTFDQLLSGKLKVNMIPRN